MRYADNVAARVPPGLSLPAVFRALFDWIESNAYFKPSHAYPGDRLRLLGTEDELQSGRITAILFRVATPEQARDFGRSWFRNAVPNIEGRLVPFARTGGDGSHAAFWRDDAGQQQIVHLGSEGLVCLLGQTPLDFLRLLAIGYAEGSGDCLDEPNEPRGEVGRNAAFVAWLTERYGVAVPTRAADLLDAVPEVLADASDDPFWRWVQQALKAG